MSRIGVMHVSSSSKMIDTLLTEYVFMQKRLMTQHCCKRRKTTRPLVNPQQPDRPSKAPVCVQQQNQVCPWCRQRVGVPRHIGRKLRNPNSIAWQLSPMTAIWMNELDTAWQANYATGFLMVLGPVRGVTIGTLFLTDPHCIKLLVLKMIILLQLCSQSTIYCSDNKILIVSADDPLLLGGVHRRCNL
jgi:hypothetical protein